MSIRQEVLKNSGLLFEEEEEARIAKILSNEKLRQEVREELQKDMKEYADVFEALGK